MEIAETGQPATAGELTRISAHVAAVGFDPAGQTRLGGRLAGLVWCGLRLGAGSRLATGEAHYRRHVVAGQEWPLGTSLDEYLASLRATVADPRAAILLDRMRGVWRLTFFAPSGPWRGPRATIGSSSAIK